MRNNLILIRPYHIMEKIVYKGRVYTRNPNAKTLSRRTYYRHKKYDSRSKRYIYETLHRVIWSDVHGKIPYDNIIHHADGNPNNNDISNLVCIPLRDHLSKYHGERKYKNSKDVPCMRCGKTFKAKTKRSLLCLDCSNLLYSSNKERLRWLVRDKTEPFDLNP